MRPARKPSSTRTYASASTCEGLRLDGEPHERQPPAPDAGRAGEPLVRVAGLQVPRVEVHRRPRARAEGERQRLVRRARVVGRGDARLARRVRVVQHAHEALPEGVGSRRQVPRRLRPGHGRLERLRDRPTAGVRGRHGDLRGAALDAAHRQRVAVHLDRGDRLVGGLGLVGQRVAVGIVEGVGQVDLQFRPGAQRRGRDPLRRLRGAVGRAIVARTAAALVVVSRIVGVVARRGWRGADPPGAAAADPPGGGGGGSLRVVVPVVVP